MLHKFQSHNFGNGFQTINSILHTDQYAPEAIFIGTFNHGWSWNKADFFYGRGMHMWTILGNLFLHNKNRLAKQRTATNLEPSLDQLFEICERGKIIFADIVKGVNPAFQTVKLTNRKCILVNNEYRWEERDGLGEYSDTHLDNLGNRGWLDHNVEAIIEHINNTPSIRHVYFTFKSGTWLAARLNAVHLGVRQNVSVCSVFTPTGNGFRKNLPPPYHKRAWSLAHCWVWNNRGGNLPIAKPGYGNLDHNWLARNGVSPDNF